MMNKMYLQNDNGGYGILIQDTENRKWYYWSEYHLPVDLDGETDEKNAAIIRAAIESGDMYDADDFITDTEDTDEHEIAAYEGLSLDDIDHMENYEQDVYSGDVHPKNCDTTYWTAI